MTPAKVTTGAMAAVAELPPFLPFYLGALLVALAPARPQWLRPALTVLTPLLGAANLLTIPAGAHLNMELLGYELNPLRADRLSNLFGYLFHLAAFIGAIYAWHARARGQQAAALLYAGSALGAVFAGDLLTLFVFWEMLAVSSVFLIVGRHSERAMQSGMRYLVVQVLSGVLLFAGAALLARGGGLTFTAMRLDSAGALLVFTAFGIKCAFPLLHNWLTDAYPEATPSGAVFLSAFSTKVAVYALARGFPGVELLIYIGVVMACFPIFYAVIENDLRRVLAYSIINQVGFMVVGIGIGSELAVNGAVSHAFSHVLYKSLLMMSMGAVLYRTGRMNGSDLGGLYKCMPKTTLLCIVGAASISAFPLFSGFVSKSMVMSAALGEGYGWVWLALLFASAGVFHHAGIKIPFFAFFAHDSGIRCKEAPPHMLLAMVIAAALCIGIGCWPWTLYQLLPFAVDYAPFDATHVVAQLQLLFFSALAFVWLKLSGIYPPELPSVNLDADFVYRKLGPAAVKKITRLTQTADCALRRRALAATCTLIQTTRRLHDDAAPASGDVTGKMVAAALVVFCAALVFYYLV